MGDPPARAGGLPRGRGFELSHSPTPDELRLRYLDPLGLGDEIVGDVELMAAARLP